MGSQPHYGEVVEWQFAGLLLVCHWYDAGVVLVQRRGNSSILATGGY